MGLINELIDSIAEDPLYQEGVLKGIEKGKRNLIIKMLKDRSLNMEKIAELAELSVAYVQQVAKELND
jgi:predicted transposase YdaD